MSKQRIRTIKPELFQHEELFALESRSGLPIRLSFMGLFTACDREGRFEWKPNILKLWVLPWDEVSFVDILDALASAEFVKKYEIDGKAYGCIPSWKKHQLINGREHASSIPSDASVTRAPRVESREQVTRCFGGGTEQNRTEQNRTEQIRTEGKGCKGRETKETNVSLSGDEDVLIGQERLIELRRINGINPDGTTNGSFGKVES